MNEYSRMIDVAYDRTSLQLGGVKLLMMSLYHLYVNIIFTYVEKMKRRTELRHEAKRKREEQAAVKATACVRRRVT